MRDPRAAAAAVSAARRRAGWFVRDRFPNRRVVREVQGVRLVLPWSHRLPDYAGSGPKSIYGQNLVHLARALALSGAEPLTMLDVGANVGDSTLQVLHALDGMAPVRADAARAARVVCVEADPAYLDFLRINTGGDPRVTIVPALLAADTATRSGGVTPVRSGGTTRFVPAAADPGAPSAIVPITPKDLRTRYPQLERLRLVKSDTDGYDTALVPAVAAAWQDRPPVLFFEYDPYLTRLAGADPAALWPRLHELGYERAAVWDHGGHPLGQVAVVDAARAARVLDDFPKGRPSRRFYWDVAAVHRGDAAAVRVLDDLVPDELPG